MATCRERHYLLEHEPYEFIHVYPDFLLFVCLLVGLEPFILDKWRGTLWIAVVLVDEGFSDTHFCILVYF